MLSFPPDLGLTVPLTVTHCPLWVGFGDDILTVYTVYCHQGSLVLYCMERRALKSEGHLISHIRQMILCTQGINNPQVKNHQEVQLSLFIPYT